jgi:lysophospholipase L1-like esterase
MFQHPMYQTSLSETANFWKGIAHRYKGVPTVAVYELFNEPTDDFIGAGAGSLGKASWEEWRKTLESLVDLVQVYDPGVIPLVAGFNWAYDLGPVADMPVRREGVAYAIHAYPQKAKPETNTEAAFSELWQKQWGYVADTYPMIATEIGWVREDGYGSHIPVINNDGTYGPNLVNFMEARNISWTVWNFDPDWSPTMIQDWNFTPTEQGRFFKWVMQKARDGQLSRSALPSPRVDEYSWMPIERWREMHAEDVAIAANGDVELLFLGDSITEGWPEPTWEKHFSRYKPANFGIGGDRTENLLWRLQNGASGQLDPRVVVLMIGVNNYGFENDSAETVFLGVKTIIEQVKSSFGRAQIVLLGVLPYGELAGTEGRRVVTETNALLAGLNKEPRVSFHDIGAAFEQPDGSISADVMADFLHPTEAGYDIFAEQLDPILSDLLQ